MKKFNINYIALLILVVAYVFAAGRFFYVAGYFGKEKEHASDEKVVRVTHWQLEPGYRDALDWAIEKYNELPHVKAANVRVEQAAITEKVYNQFMNVHLISGTAPDIAAKGKTQLIKGNAVARYYAPLGVYINDPNPYNTAEYLDPDLDPELAEYLGKASWKDTFTDGMLGGFDEELDDYYAIPISTWGSMRMFYNAKLLDKIKTFIEEAMEKQPQPAWLQACWIKKDADGQTTGYLPNNQRLHDWLKTDEPPETMGQLILYCEATLAYAEAENRPYLVPVSASNYTISNLAQTYEASFMTEFTEKGEVEIGSGVDSFETYAAWGAGIWSFDSPAIDAYYQFAQLVNRYFPQGYLGLDREQAQRRFILGNAAMISSGGWDAAGIFAGATNRDDPEDSFDVIVRPVPMPAADERWAEYLKYPKSEADFKAGVPMAVNKQSPNLDWSLDFLRFITSQPINEGLNQRAAWLSSIVGGENVDDMKPFTPEPEGFPPGDALSVRGAIAKIDTYFISQSNLVTSGDISLDTFKERMQTYLSSPRLGVDNYWFRKRQEEEDKSVARDRSISVEGYQVLMDDDPNAAIRLRALFYNSLILDEAINIQKLWEEYHPGKPFPQF